MLKFERAQTKEAPLFPTDLYSFKRLSNGNCSFFLICMTLTLTLTLTYDLEALHAHTHMIGAVLVEIFGF